MSHPHLLVIGAMKCGTTTLYHDLQQHPSVDIGQKEFGGLRRFNMDSPKGRRGYLNNWVNDPTTCAVEVDTTYAMAPHLSSVAAQAAKVVPEAHVLYVMRDPVERAISHHHHDFSSGAVGSDINRAFREDPRFVDYSRYSRQIGEWYDHFPPGAIHLLKLEDYTVDRRVHLDNIWLQMGVSPMPPNADLSRTLNQATTRRASHGPLRRVIGSDLYRHGVRGIVPTKFREFARDRLVGVAPPRPPVPTPTTLTWLVEQLSTDVRQLSELTEGRINWDLSKHAASWKP